MASYIVQKAKIKYGQGTGGVVYCSKSKNNVWLRYCWSGILFKKQKQGTPGFSFIEIAEIRFCWGFILLKTLK